MNVADVCVPGGSDAKKVWPKSDDRAQVSLHGVVKNAAVQRDP